MPCYDGGPSYDETVARNNKIDELTRMLCRTLKLWEQAGKPFKLSSDTGIWWQKHKEADRQRIEADLKERKRRQAKKKALDKLTPEERRLLGL